MNFLWIILGLVCAGIVLALIAFIVFVAYVNISERRGIAHVMEHGSSTVGWIVQANDNLFQDGTMPSYPAFVLISPDKQTTRDEEFMTGLAGRIMELKGEDCEDEEERVVSGLITDESIAKERETGFLVLSPRDARSISLTSSYAATTCRKES